MTWLGRMIDQETLFIQGITQLAEKYGVKIDIDFDNYTINVDGEPTDEVAMAIEIDNMFGGMAA